MRKSKNVYLGLRAVGSHANLSEIGPHRLDRAFVEHASSRDERKRGKRSDIQNNGKMARRDSLRHQTHSLHIEKSDK